MQKSKTLTFASNNRDFSVMLNKRVNDYFKINNVNRQANREMIIKTIFMYALYVIPYGLIVGALFSHLRLLRQLGMKPV